MPRSDGEETQATQPREGGAGTATRLDVVSLPYVRLSQRGRRPPARRGRWALVAVVLAAHVLLVWIAWWILRPVPYQRDESGVFRVTLIEPTGGLPPPPPLVPPPPPLPGRPVAPAPPRHLHYVPPAKGAIRATLEGAKGPSLDLYAPNGQIRVPAQGSGQPKTAPAYSTPGIKGSHIYSGTSPVPYKPTRFNKDWAPVNESLGQKTIGRALDKAIEKTTVQKAVKLPGGMKVHCVLSPLRLIAGCVPPPPPPPPKNDDDIRLSMPPAETLTGRKVPLPKPATSAAPASAASGG